MLANNSWQEITRIYIIGEDQIENSTWCSPTYLSREAGNVTFHGIYGDPEYDNECVDRQEAGDDKQ